MPWDEDGTDYDEPKPSGDSHEDEFDEEYGEQQPKGIQTKRRPMSWPRPTGPMSSSGRTRARTIVSRTLADTES